MRRWGGWPLPEGPAAGQQARARGTMTSGLFTRVTFKVSVETQFGDAVYVTGNAPILGYWKTDKGFKLETGDGQYPVWTGQALIHSGFSLEYKYIILRGGEVIWETGPVNRCLKTSLEMMIVDDGWFNGVRVGVQTAPLQQDGDSIGPASEAEDKGQKVSLGALKKVNSAGSKAGSTSSSNLGKGQGVVIVAAVLPVKVGKNAAGTYDIAWDTKRTVSKLRDPNRNFKYVGWVGVAVPEEDQAAVRERLIKEFDCFPVFLDHGVAYRVFDLFCQSVLSPLFHHIIELAEEGSEACWNWDHWHEYERVNKTFSDLALTTAALGGPYAAGDRLWVLDYEMMLVPHYASRKNPHAPIGYSFLSVFPSTEVFRVLPVRIEVLCALLCSDLVSFDLFEYARHFLHCCSRLLGLEHRSRRGLIGVDYNGRRVNVRCGLIGFHVSGTRELRDSARVQALKSEYAAALEGKKVIVSCDKMDRLSGITLKLTAFESLMRHSSHVWSGKVVLVQLLRLPYSTYASSELLPAQLRELEQIKKMAAAINAAFPDSVRLITPAEESPEKRLAYFGIASLYLNTSVRTGLDWSPFEFVMCSEKQMAPLCVSEFLGCSRVLSGSFSVNPWNVDCVVDAVEKGLQLSHADRQTRLKRLYQFVANYDIDKWADSILTDIWLARKDDNGSQAAGLGLGPDSRFLRLDAACVYTHLDINEVVEKYKRSSRRVILLDYGSAYAPHSLVGNLMVDARRAGARGATPSRPDAEFIESVKSLAKDERNTVFLLSSQETSMVQEWFTPELWAQYWANLGVTAENGCFYRWGKATWENLTDELDFSWKERARKLLRMYTDRVHGTYVQVVPVCVHERVCVCVWVCVCVCGCGCECVCVCVCVCVCCGCTRTACTGHTCRKRRARWCGTMPTATRTGGRCRRGS